MLSSKSILKLHSAKNLNLQDNEEITKLKILKTQSFKF